MAGYILLFWQLILSYYFSHINLSRDFTAITDCSYLFRLFFNFDVALVKASFIVGKAKIVLVIIIVVFLSVLLLVILYSAGIFENQILVLTCAIIKVSICGIVVIGQSFQVFY